METSTIHQADGVREEEWAESQQWAKLYFAYNANLHQKADKHISSSASACGQSPCERVRTAQFSPL